MSMRSVWKCSVCGILETTEQRQAHSGRKMLLRNPHPEVEDWTLDLTRVPAEQDVKKPL